MENPAKYITIDVETDGLNPWKDKLVLIGYRINGKGPVGFIWPANDALTSPSNVEFIKMVADPSIIKRGHNIKFDALFLRNSFYPIVGPFDDTRIMAYCESPFQDVGLKDLVRERLKRSVVEFKELQRAISG